MPKNANINISIVKIWAANEIPSGKLTQLAGISPCLMGNTSSKGPFSIAMLDYQSIFWMVMDGPKSLSSSLSWAHHQRPSGFC